MGGCTWPCPTCRPGRAPRLRLPACAHPTPLPPAPPPRSFNDDQVTRVQPAQVVSQYAYILFYVRRQYRPRGAGPAPPLAPPEEQQQEEQGAQAADAREQQRQDAGEGRE